MKAGFTCGFDLIWLYRILLRFLDEELLCGIVVWYGSSCEFAWHGTAARMRRGERIGAHGGNKTFFARSFTVVCLSWEGRRQGLNNWNACLIFFFFAWDYILPSTSRTRCGMQSTQSASSTRHGYYKRGSSHREWHYIYCCTLQKVSPYRRQPIDMTKTCLILDANIYI